MEDKYNTCPITGEPFPGSPDDYLEEDEQVTLKVTCDAVRNMIAQVQEIFPYTIKFDLELSMDGESNNPMIIISCLNLETGKILEAYFTCTPPKFGEFEEES